MKTVAIIQARMGSTRLPGKVLKVLGDKTVLAQVVSRVECFQGVQDIIIATTSDAQDDPIMAEANRLGVHCFRGSEQDVLARYYEAAKGIQADNVVRITSDCPLIDPQTSSEIIQKFTDSVCDYASNTLERTYPRGLDTEVFSFASLEVAHWEAVSNHDREHVTPYLYNNRKRFTCHSVVSYEGIEDYRWTLDTPEDWSLIKRIYDALYDPGSLFNWRDAAALMQKNPEWNMINQHVQQK
ncbi:NTP transferase domain-containing protein [Paenibacillus sp. 5J-6]|uniref:NTP transferase domain-containing protein n=1 Tax=Paenibacillus silvestris TaxID=2606219 RepID=A0A6L8V7Z7_9BACL|nr:glycosyltransferase family protein [Paenibacillus silvestris]MZQ85772.1 NTP transferase domain-containing protein [Paenibacillus silvestris]